MLEETKVANSDDTGQKRVAQKEINSNKSGGTKPERIDGPAVGGIKKAPKPPKS